MTDDVKSRRKYDSSRRQAQAEQTRLDIVSAAHELFVDNGYAGTTLAAVAKRAGVVVETVYRAFDNKAGLFKAVIEAAVAGGAERAATPPEAREAIADVIAETDPATKLAKYARTQPGIHRRSGPLLRALAAAAATDRTLAELSAQLDRQRRAGMQRFAGHLAEQGMLRDGLSVDEAGDVLWTMNALAVHDLFVLHQGWSPERYRDWLADSLYRLLVAP